MENEPESANGFFGKGIYFYESIQKAIENTFVYKNLAKRDLLESMENGQNPGKNNGKNSENDARNNLKNSSCAPEWNQISLETEFLMTEIQLNNSQVAVPRLGTNLFFVLFDVATGKEFNNENYLFLNELPLGFHSAKMDGKFQPNSIQKNER